MVSVIIPTYGGGADLDRVIESILQQTYRDVEILVVDDNGYGTENQKKTAAIMEKYSGFENVTYVTPPHNGGGSAARNRGAQVSKGEYLMFLDDDDTVSPDKIARQVEALSEPGKNYGIAYCSTKIFVGGQESNVINAVESGDILYRYMMGKVYMGTGTALLLREAWESLGGYDESFVRHQDWEFFARVLNKYDAVAVPDVYFHRYIVNRNLPKKLDLLEQYADHYISFLQQYAFRLPRSKIRNVINLNNARIALRCLKEKNIRRFVRTLGKYDTVFRAYLSFALFVLSVCADKIKGKKT